MSRSEERSNTFTEPPKAMARERAKARFPQRAMTNYLNGGEARTRWLEESALLLERSPAFYNKDFYDDQGDHELVRVRTMARVAAIAQHFAKFIADGRSETDIRRFFSLAGLIDPASYTRIGVHYALFLNGVRGSGTPEQLNYWINQGALVLKNFFGCFGMTELGHGSNVAGIETTATYDPSTEEFIINTPTVAASKWWIGGAAHTATHCLVYARLIVKNKDYGVKNFVVPLRNRDNWTLLPGISIGDIGKKMGRDGIDNGWIQFNNVRIPRVYMLMKYSKVDKDGNVTQPPMDQLSYGALLTGRVSMVVDSYTWATRFLTIALRFAATRAQFGSKEGCETKLLDYKYHQRRLLPRLAYTFAINAASENLEAFQKATTSKMTRLKPDDKTALDASIQDLKELFSLSAGLKAFATWDTAQTIDECRQSTGGFGYSAYNGFGQGYDDWVVQCTWEGDNNILTLSAGRALIQSALALRKGKRVGQALRYVSRDLHAKLNGRSLEDPAVLRDAWEHVAANAINSACDQYEALLRKGLLVEQAFEKLSQQRFNIARLHTIQYIVTSFLDRVQEAEDSIKPTLLDLALLYALWAIEKDAAVFLRYEFLQADHIAHITELVNTYVGRVREQAIPITDSFNLSDFFINAPIGNYDGDLYRNYFNKTIERNPPLDSFAPYFETVQKPFYHRNLQPKPDLSDLTD